jgi:hypothetical protein
LIGKEAGEGKQQTEREIAIVDWPQPPHSGRDEQRSFDVHRRWIGKLENGTRYSEHHEEGDPPIETPAPFARCLAAEAAG